MIQADGCTEVVVEVDALTTRDPSTSKSVVVRRIVVSETGARSEVEVLVDGEVVYSSSENRKKAR